MNEVSDIGMRALKSLRFREALECKNVEGLHGSLKGFFVACLSEFSQVPPPRICVLTKWPDELAQDIRVWLEAQESGGKRDPRLESGRRRSQRVWCIPEREDGELKVKSEKRKVDSVIFPPEVKSEVLAGLSALVRKEEGVFVSAPIEELPSPEELRVKSLELRVKSGELRMNDLVNKLSNAGFTRVGTVEEIGEFAVRGGIIDLWGYGMSNPIRVEWTGDEIESIREFDPIGQRSFSMVNEAMIMPVDFKTGGASITDYLPEDTLIVVDRTMNIKYQISNIKYQIIYLGEGYVVGSVSSYQGNIRVFKETLKKLKGYKVFVVCENETEKSRILEIVNRELIENWEEKAEDELLRYQPKLDVRVVHPLLSSGFIFLDAKIAVFTYSDIFGHKVKVRHPPRHLFKGKGIAIQDLTMLHPGEYVVHVDYGIGIYRGIKKLKVKSEKLKVEMDCLVIEYREGDMLYVPVDKFHLVERYVTPYDKPPELTKLDSESWERRKSNAKKKIQDLTRELLSLYAERKVRKGYKFLQDTVWQADVESKFPYEETEDQLKVIDDTKGDMEAESAMDRLVCGEVGYGKTEVVLRAAFKAVMDGKQVAVLCPTTILAEQHTRTFKSRLIDFPIIVEQFSRFRKRIEQQRVIESLGRGSVDIVIGTHRLLSEDVRFKDLGLLIIDEEHRFGVAQKEKLKKLKKNVDTLSLTATPIPRTLYMSLVRIRDVSTLDTPPLGRQPIVTHVCEWDEGLIERAIYYEISRGGQVYFVHNRIRSIDIIADIIRRMDPSFKVGVTHAELHERELEDVMLRFLEGEINVLVTTAIIGSGIDIPRVNTMIINRADRFGLAELHQLRGRVGRSDKRAYCYLLAPRRPNPEARKRLQAIATHTELGAGFKLALRDLEIRGAGNLLGREQHGHIHAIGYELYTRLLEEEIKRIKGEKVVERVEPEIELGVSCYIPDRYVDCERKLNLYKRLACCNALSEVDEFEEEMRDRFGEPPKPVKFLLLAAQIKILARERRIMKIQNSKFKIQKGYELVFPEMPKKLWFKRKEIAYVNPVTEGISIGVNIRNAKELKDFLISKSK